MGQKDPAKKSLDLSISGRATTTINISARSKNQAEREEVPKSIYIYSKCYQLPKTGAYQRWEGYVHLMTAVRPSHTILNGGTHEIELGEDEQIASIDVEASDSLPRSIACANYHHDVRISLLPDGVNRC